MRRDRMAGARTAPMMEHEAGSVMREIERRRRAKPPSRRMFRAFLVMTLIVVAVLLALGWIAAHPPARAIPSDCLIINFRW